MDFSNFTLSSTEVDDSSPDTDESTTVEPKLNFSLWSSSEGEVDVPTVDEDPDVESSVVEDSLDELFLDDPVDEEWSNPVLEEYDEKELLEPSKNDVVATVDGSKPVDSTVEEEVKSLDDVLFYGRNTMKKHHHWRKVSEKDRVKRNSKSRKYNKLKYASNHKSPGAKERLVDGDGNPLARDSGARLQTGEQFKKLLDQVEKTGDVRLSEKAIVESDSFVTREKPDLEVIYPFRKKLSAPSAQVGDSKVRVKQRVGEQEKRFFRESGLSFTKAMSDAEYSVAYRELLRKDAIKTERRTRKLEPSQYLVNPGGEGIRSFEKFGQYSMVWSDMEILEFLVRFRYASPKTIARMLGVTEGTAKTRLSKLKKLGLAGSIDLFGSTSLWVCTNAGKLMCGVELPLVTPRKLSLPLIPHQTVVNNIAAQLWNGQVNCLMLDEFPVRNRIDAKGRRVYGETLVSETELASSFRTMTKLDRSEIYRSRLQSTTEELFARWREQMAEQVTKTDTTVGQGGGKGLDRSIGERSTRVSATDRLGEKDASSNAEGGGSSAREGAGSSANEGVVDQRSLRSPEQHYGNEWLYVLIPPFALKRAYHYPDLVIQRDRRPDGTPASIAVEVETNSNKTSDDYTITLEAYKADRTIYGSVIWVCRTGAAAKAVERAARQVGLWQEGRIDIVPIITEKGVHEGRDLWLM